MDGAADCKGLLTMVHVLCIFILMQVFMGAYVHGLQLPLHAENQVNYVTEM